MTGSMTDMKNTRKQHNVHHHMHTSLALSLQGRERRETVAERATRTFPYAGKIIVFQTNIAGQQVGHPDSHRRSLVASEKAEASVSGSTNKEPTKMFTNWKSPIKSV